MKWRGIIFVLILSIFVSIFSGCVDRSDISGISDIVEGSNNGNLKNILKMMPNDKQGGVLYLNLKMMREKEYIQNNLKEIEKDLPKGFEMIKPDNVDHVAMGTGINAEIFMGSFDMKKVISRLNEKSKRDTYLDMEYWIGDGKETPPTVIINDKLIMAISPNDTRVPKAFIRVSKGINESLYEGNEDVRDVAEKIPGGIMVIIGNGWVKDIAEIGLSVLTGDQDTLRVKGIFKLNNEDYFTTLKDSIGRNPGTGWNLTAIELQQDGKFVQLNARMQLRELFKYSRSNIAAPTTTPKKINNTEVLKTPVTTPIPVDTPPSKDYSLVSEKTITLSTGDSWNLGRGYELKVLSVDARTYPKQVWIMISKDGNKLDDKIFNLGELYKLESKNGVILFMTRVADISSGSVADTVTFKNSYIYTGTT